MQFIGRRFYIHEFYYIFYLQACHLYHFCYFPQILHMHIASVDKQPLSTTGSPILIRCKSKEFKEKWKLNETIQKALGLIKNKLFIYSFVAKEAKKVLKNLFNLKFLFWTLSRNKLLILNIFPPGLAFLSVNFVISKERECHDVYTTLVKLCQPGNWT